MLIQYVGTKPEKVDNVANTGLVWFGHGDVQEVKDESAAKKLLAFPGVWQEASESAGPDEAEADGDTPMTKPDLLALAERLGVKVDTRWGVKRLADAIEAAGKTEA